MNKLLSALMVAILLVSIGCSNSSGGKYDNPSESDSDMEVAALAAAQRFVHSEYAADAVFDGSQVTIDQTSVENRYKIMQRFDSEQRDGYNFIYRIWVQKFSTGWEFGNLSIERAGGERVLTVNGRMKDMEQKEMTRTEESSADGVEYTIIKRNAPNYVRVYTPSRLERDDVLKVYNQLKDQYEQIQFSKSRNPEDDDYLAILDDMVFEYDIDKITSLSKY